MSTQVTQQIDPEYRELHAVDYTMAQRGTTYTVVTATDKPKAWVKSDTVVCATDHV